MRSAGFILPHKGYYKNGWSACARKRPAGFPRKLLRSAKGWPCTGATGSPARAAGPRFSVSAMLRTRPTTARCARREDVYWPIALSAVCWEKIGRALSKNWKNFICVRDRRSQSGELLGDTPPPKGLSLAEARPVL